MTELDDAAIDELTVAQLKAELKARGLVQKGVKKDLVARLREYIAEHKDNGGGQSKVGPITS